MAGMMITISAILVCPAVSEETTVAVSIDELMSRNHIQQEVDVPVGKSLKVELGSNPTTGFRWSKTADISDASVLKQIRHEYIASDSRLDGAPGKDAWIFQTMKAGTCTVFLSYERPWKGGEKHKWTFSLMVNVTK